ncbi:hypothetical protein SCHPADRAFT_905640 [Schizopora paradoxa]|uniref:RING-type domain-containing protein n=1 Tax=Schizopora paradoxa TaxID=27342 RepID=A0A0H2RQV5_9AGAM|nr:hypothetical protein SCHPADRAFT_905640 [Schizopora paradoxa]
MNGDVSQPQQGSSTQAQEPTFDFWEFVACSKCNLPFVSDGNGQPSVPFWLTECCHVVCNSHLNADQSCPVCQAPGIELMPLQKDLPAPMSDWFSYIPYRLDAMGQAIRVRHSSR